MTLLHRVWVYLKCERCEKMHETDIRFRCWNVEIDDYRLGERVPDGEPLTVGEVYEGNADRYCRDCFGKWAAAQALFAYESLVELMEQGRVVARDGGESLSKEDVLEYGRKYTEEKINQPQCLIVTIPYFTELELSCDGKPVGHELGNKGWDELLFAIEPLLQRRFSENGWTAGDCTWKDFRMYLDDDRRIVVEDEHGEIRIVLGGGQYRPQ